MSIRSIIHFTLGEKWYGWPVEYIEPMALQEGDEGMWFIAPRELKLMSMQAHLSQPPLKGAVAFSLELCHWDGSRWMRLRDWLGKHLRFLSPWKRLAQATVPPSEPQKQQAQTSIEFPKPIPIAVDDCLRIRIETVGSGPGPSSNIEVTGGGLNVSVLSEYRWDARPPA